MNGDAEQRVRLPSNRDLLRLLAVIGLFVLGCYVLVAIRSALFDVFIAVFFAIVLEPLVRFMERRLRLRRSFAVLLAMFLVLATAVGAVLIIVAPFYSQLHDLVNALPSLSDELKQQDVVKQVNNDGDFTGSLHNAAAWLSENLPGITASVFGLAGSIFGAVFTAVTILFMTLFLSLEGNRIGQYAAYSKGGQRGTNRPDHDFGWGSSTNDKAADHDIVASANLAARRDIAHGGIARGKIVEFAKCVALSAIGTSENSGITSGCQTGHNDRFGRV